MEGEYKQSVHQKNKKGKVASKHIFTYQIPEDFFLILHSVAEDMFTAGKRVNTWELSRR